MFGLKFGHQKELTYCCPYTGCYEKNKQEYSENDLVNHCITVHCRENSKQVCPICTIRNRDDSLKGSRTWGFSTHIYYEHGEQATKEQKEKNKIKEYKEKQPTYAFALVVVRNPLTGKYLLVEESCNQGYWLPGGRVDPGERFEEAAIRETIEEAGIEITLKGIIRIEYSPYKDGGARERIIFYGEPNDPHAQPKTIPDFESVGAEWFSYDEFEEYFLEKKTKHLRSHEPIDFFKYVHLGKQIYPIDLLTLEGSPVNI
ncbi:hypothetical protein ABK040_012903 [Willaertia magna]